ncbi:sulfatase [Nocardioides nanhaiensis]|uniref:Sulfatase n=2 Tax=Nocardioides nanhaiensis TaxID=1476871 RepID=A0ABP8W612_9ACTN
MLPTAPARGGRPNILLITADDQTDTEMRWMPRTRRLLTRAGIDFPDAVNPHPLCCPARAEILTGEYAQNNGVRHNTGRFGGYETFMRHNATSNLATWMRGAGYRTALVGKMMNGYPGRNARRMPGWDFWSPISGGIYDYFGSTFVNNGDPLTTSRSTHSSDVISRETVRLITTYARQRKPFFIWASHVGPHDATDRRGRWGPPPAAARHAGLFRRTLPPNRDKPSVTDPRLAGKPSAVKRLARRGLADQTVLFRHRIRNLQAIDEANAAAIRALRRTGELADTVVVYTSDNGYLLGEHGVSTKDLPYEEALQIPLSMRGPGIKRGTRSTETASMVDLAPTFLDYAGVLGKVRRQGRTDGETLRPVIAGRARLSDTTLTQAGTAEPRKVAAFGWEWRGVRTGRYTYTRWWNGFEELYDRDVDPYQQVNLHRDARYAAVLGDLRSRYRRLADCAGLEECERQDFGADPTPS